MIDVTCGMCGQAYRVSAAMAGKTFTCTNCIQPVRVPVPVTPLVGEPTPGQPPELLLGLTAAAEAEQAVMAAPRVVDLDALYPPRPWIDPDLALRLRHWGLRIAAVLAVLVLLALLAAYIISLLPDHTPHALAP